MTDIEYLNKSIREKIVERVKNGFFDGAGGYLKAMDYYAKGLISLDTVKAIETEIEAWELSKEAPVVEDDTTTEEEISADDIAGGVIKETETKIIEDASANEGVIEETPADEPTE